MIRLKSQNSLPQVNDSCFHEHRLNPMNTRRLLLLCLGTLALGVLLGCDPDRPTAGITADHVSGIVGSYSLKSVNGKPLPVTVANGVRVHSGKKTLNPDGSCRSSTIFSPPEGGRITR